MASKDALRDTDAQYIFKALNHATTPIVINCTTLAAEEDAKVSTIQKRISVMAKRWNLPISTTTKGDGGTAPTTPARPRANAATKTPGSTGGRKRKVPAKNMKKEEGEGSDEDGEGKGENGEVAVKKQKTTDGGSEHNGNGGAEAEGESSGKEVA